MPKKSKEKSVVSEKAPAVKPAAKKHVGFNLLQRATTAPDAVRETLLRTRKRFYKNFAGDPNKDRLMIPIPEFTLALALRSRGFVSGTIMDVLGPEGSGKTTLMFTTMGWFIRHNAPCWYGESENKPMDEKRIERCLHWDRDLARAMRQTIYMEPVREITDWYEKMEAWLMLIRESTDPDVRVPIEVPAIMCIDTFSKLLSPGQAGGFVKYQQTDNNVASKKTGKEAKKEKDKKKKEDTAQGINEGSNLEHSKLAHKICRRLPHLLGTYNAFLMLSRHQNEKVDMSGGGGSFIPADVAETFNTASIGGKAFGQSSAYQMIIGRKGFETVKKGDQNVKVGVNLGLNVVKNSFGPPGSCDYRLMTTPRLDDDKSQEMVLNFNAGLVKAVLATGMVPLTAHNKNSITCSRLRLEKASLAEFTEAFYASPDLMPELMKRLEFMGCESGIKFPELNESFATAAKAEFDEDGENKAPEELEPEPPAPALDTPPAEEESEE